MDKAVDKALSEGMFMDNPYEGIVFSPDEMLDMIKKVGEEIEELKRRSVAHRNEISVARWNLNQVDALLEIKHAMLQSLGDKLKRIAPPELLSKYDEIARVEHEAVSGPPTEPIHSRAPRSGSVTASRQVG